MLWLQVETESQSPVVLNWEPISSWILKIQINFSTRWEEKNSSICILWKRSLHEVICRNYVTCSEGRCYYTRRFPRAYSIWYNPRHSMSTSMAKTCNWAWTAKKGDMQYRYVILSSIISDVCVGCTGTLLVASHYLSRVRGVIPVLSKARTM